MFTWCCKSHALLLLAFVYHSVNFSQESHSGDWGHKAGEAHDVAGDLQPCNNCGIASWTAEINHYLCASQYLFGCNIMWHQ